MGGPTHQRLQLAGAVVINEQFFGERGLIVQHVDQKAESAQVVAQLVERSGGTGPFFVDFVDQHFLDYFAHPQHRLRGLVESQDRKHAAHLREVVRRVAQRTLVLRVAKEVVQQLLQLTESHAQFADDAAHGLAVTDPPVQLLHPGFQRLGMPALADSVQPLGQTSRPSGELGVGGVEVFERRLKIQDGSRHFHRQFRPRGTSRTRDTVDCRV